MEGERAKKGVDGVNEKKMGKNAQLGHQNTGERVNPP